MNDYSTERSCQPFLKWAGGKRWLINHCSLFIPTHYNSYIEPFLGSGAMFFALQPKRAILSDLNLDLIQAYRAIRSDWRSVVEALKKHHCRHSRDYYYEIRSSSPRELARKAARLVYLNRTCWNGLYRVNKQGRFNVPVGTKAAVCLRTDDFELVHRLLRRACLIRSDFETVIDKARARDLLFVDPPYTTSHSNNGFIKYNEKLFGWPDQVRLRDCLQRAQRRGAYVIATNADHDGIRQLYAGSFHLQSLRRVSVIASNSRFRQNIRELLITSLEGKIK